MSCLRKGAIALFTTVALLGFIGTAAADEMEDMKRRIAALEAEKGGGDGSGSYLTKLGSMFEVYGFLRLDVNYHDSEMSDTQVKFRVLSEATNKDDADLSIYPRLTRIGANFKGGTIDNIDAVLTGKLELDFYGSASDSRNELRMRKAYLQLQTDEWQLLVGQTSDLISPLYPTINYDMINWYVGNLGDRRPQIRFSYFVPVGDGRLSVQVAATQADAISQLNTDGGDGVLDGEDAGQPLWQERVAFKSVLFGEEPTEIGVWGAQGQQEVDGDGFGRFDITGYGIDVRVPIVEQKIYFQGELWDGENLRDLRGGVAQGINAAGMEVEAMGGWGELQYICDCGKWVAGYTFDSPDREDVAAGTGVTNNSAIYTGFTYTEWNPVKVGVEYMHWRTRYRGADGGEANTVKFWVAYYF